MMVTYTITKNVWKKISSAGESGTLWRKSANGFIPHLLICHTDSAQDPADDIPLASAVDLDVDASMIWKTNEVTPVLEAENGGDIWYVTFRNGAAGATCEITADFLS